MKSIRLILKQSLKDAALFSACYFFIFLFSIHSFTDGGETMGMFIILDFAIAILAIFYYLVIAVPVLYSVNHLPVVARAALLFFAIELALLTITGESALVNLGKYYFTIQRDNPGYDFAEFRYKRDVALILSNTITTAIFILLKFLGKKQAISSI